jgi:hypothetical protein
MSVYDLQGLDLRQWASLNRLSSSTLLESGLSPRSSTIAASLL